MHMYFHVYRISSVANSCDRYENYGIPLKLSGTERGGKKGTSSGHHCGLGSDHRWPKSFRIPTMRDCIMLRVSSSRGAGRGGRMRWISFFLPSATSSSVSIRFRRISFLCFSITSVMRRSPSVKRLPVVRTDE